MKRLMIAVLAFSLTTAALGESPPSKSHGTRSSTLGTVESRSVVFQYDNADPYDRTNLYGFNHAPSVTRLDDDRLLAAWFSGPYEASIHQVILGAESADGGRAWHEAAVLNDAPRLSDFGPAFIGAGDRTLLFYSTGRWTRWPFVGLRDAESKQVGGISFTIHMRQRRDRDAAWSESVDVESKPGWNCRSNGLRMSNGELILPIHRLHPLPYVASVLISANDGQSWTQGPEISTPAKIGAAEPSVAELPGGQLVMVLRANGGRIWLTRSVNFGRTWSKPERTELEAATSSSNVFCTSNGRLLLTYNSSWPNRTRLSLRASDDAGASWSELLTLAEIEAPGKGEEVYSRQVCYPSVCELTDGSLRIVWARIEIGPTLQSGVIESTRVRLR